jgi:hypothetical protein
MIFTVMPSRRSKLWRSRTTECPKPFERSEIAHQGLGL